MSTKNFEVDMCTGPLLGKMIKFTLPIIATVLLQQLFNTADLIVVGKFGHDGALASVGATASVTGLIVNLFVGFSVGVGICIARYYGAKSYKQLTTCVNTSVTISLVCGTFLVGLGLLLSRVLLELFATPPEVIENSLIYMRICFLGMPFVMLFNFCASILRAVGDSKRTLIYISTAGVINVILNLIFVIMFDMNVAGVALATVISQGYSALMSLRCLIKYDGCLKLDVKKLRINFKELKNIAIIGIPSGIQATLFSISNSLIQASINSFGTAAISGNTAAGNIEAYIYVVMNSVSNTTTNFTGQNYGAQDFKRIRKICVECCIMATIIGIVLGALANIFGRTLLGFYTNVDKEIEYGLVRLSYIALYYFLCGIMEVLMGSLKGMCHPIISMTISLIGACVFRVIWIYTIFVWYRSLQTLYLSYVVSWIIVCIGLLAALIYYLRKESHSQRFLSQKA